ncbi:uncharacterized protein LOC123403234 [Hordeum vulgare subsp. vulgare]|uniref:Uncharacterized protein n=1 Tax=Hordeum vulgare subsp. vulgare TaxID=112509 RepID=A0A8I7BCN4_HORVV|nr:uncharacterized protein LOC123403234 [Hordeum vulgare subsp. vulgare]KAI4966055.1 hypothetical protein ZWY2020_046735 [Hordeum vulgare]KAI4982808.1 hypothetical protein ZWY2020_023300 [Hordeum vulgare]
MANPSALTSTSRASCGASSTGGKLTCLCSPTSHPGSFRCTRHRNPRGRPQTSSPSPSGRASQQAASPGSSATVTRSGGMTSKGRSVLRAHLLRLVSAPSSAGRDHRRCRDFEPRPSRLGRLAATVTA